MIVKRLKDGSWLVEGRIPPTRDGKRIRKVVPDLLAAHRLIAGGEATEIPKDLGPSLKSFSEVFLRRHPPALRDPLTYKSNVSLLIAGLGGETKLGAITPGMIEDFRIARVTNDKVRPYSVTRQTACLSAMFTCAARWGDWKGANPCREIEVPPEPPPRDRVFSQEEIKAILSAAASDPPFHAMIATALFCGLRRGSLQTLEWGDLRDGMVVLQMQNVKGRRGHRVPIHKDLQAILDRLPRPDGCAFVFNRDGKAFTDDMVRSAWARVLKAAGIKDKRGSRFHDLRRSFGTNALEQGVPTGIIQALLGHVSEATTRAYLHLQDAALVGVVDRLGPRLADPTGPDRHEGSDDRGGGDKSSGGGKESRTSGQSGESGNP